MRRNQALKTQCPLEAVLDLMGNKWKAAILYELLKGSKRYGELKESLFGISERMLTLQLRELMAAHLVRRESLHPNSRQVIYHLTNAGKQLEPTFQQLLAWHAQWQVQSEMN